MRQLFHRKRWRDPRLQLPNVMSNTLPVRSIEMLRKAFDWVREPELVGDHLGQFQYFEDLNERRLRDAEVIATVCANHSTPNIVEIGTAGGVTTALMAVNSPSSIVHTINIPPEEIHEGGHYTTFAPSHIEIGKAYRDLGLKNVRQIFANTAHWKNNISPIGIALIDGCHDAEFVYSDSKKLIASMPPGSFILWHDFAPELARVYPWIADVCLGVERLFTNKIIKGRILHLDDSWIGLHHVE